MALVPDEGAVQQLAPASPDPAFGDRVHARRRDVAEHGPDPGVGEDRVERGGEVRAAVADHELGPVRLIAGVHQEVAGLLGGPFPGGMQGDAELSALPSDLVRARPRLLLAQALMAATSGHIEAVEPLLDAAEHASEGAAEEPFEPTVGRGGSLLVNIPALIALQRSYLGQLRGDADATAAFASQALAGLNKSESTLGSIAQGMLAVAEWLRGRLAEAEHSFVPSIAAMRAAGLATWSAWKS